MNEDEALKYGRLPVKVLAPRILRILQKYSPDFIESIGLEIETNRFNSNIGYDVSLKKIEIIAAIDEFEGKFEIKISEPYLAFLWCLSYAFVAISSQNKSNEQALDLLFYGISLFDEWSEWPQKLPNPQYPDPTDRYIDKANWIMTFAGIFILYHEYAHQYLGHVFEIHTDYDQYKEDEFNADSHAVSCVLDMIKVYNNELEHTGKVAIVVGICSILFGSKDLSGNATHPDTDQRIIKVVNAIIDDDPESEYWIHAIQLLHIWAYIYDGRALKSPIEITPKGYFEWLSKELKSKY